VPDTDVLVIGGGPAGLAAAIAARRKGFSVAVVDAAVPPIDKACGEGLMPDALSALAELGIQFLPGLNALPRHPLRGRGYNPVKPNSQLVTPHAARPILHQIPLDAERPAWIYSGNFGRPTLRT
jgi:2-polyprenyl-6-methoxyphenol hydroxylase-like FAD-dependent oxidoreductase